jgi:glycosyltransferase involved in cell wall biosynthesis
MPPYNRKVHKISVLLPFNEFHSYLEPAIESILSSRYENFELVLISDGVGKDDLHRLEKWFSHPKLVVLENSGQGIVDALNSGIRHSSSEYIARMDSDDISAPERLVSQSAFLDANPTVDVVGSNIKLICSHGRIFGRSSYPRRLGRSFATKSFSSRLAHPAVMMRREALLRAGMYRSLYPGSQAEDFDLWNRLLRDGKIANLRQHLLQYRVHADQVSTKKRVVMAESTKLAVLIDINETFGALRNQEVALEGGATELESQLLSEPFRLSLSWQGRVRLAFYLSSLNARAALDHLAIRLRLSSRQLGDETASFSQITKWILGNPLMFVVSAALHTRTFVSRMASRRTHSPCKECGALL